MKKKSCYPMFISMSIPGNEVIPFTDFIEKLDFQSGFQMENINGNIKIICFSGSSFDYMGETLMKSQFASFGTLPISEMIWD